MAADASEEIEHMEARHPEIIDQRLSDAGFVLRDGVWYDRHTDALAPDHRLKRISN